MLLVRRLGLIRTVLVFGVYHRLQITDPVLGRTLAGHWAGHWLIDITLLDLSLPSTGDTSAQLPAAA